MKTILNKKHIVTLSILLIVDIIIISSAILYYQPDNSISIALLFIIPKIFLANLIIAGILYFIKKYYAIFFIINAFLSPCLLYFLFVQYGSFLLIILNIPYYIPISIKKEITIPLNIARSQVYQLAKEKE